MQTDVVGTTVEKVTKATARISVQKVFRKEAQRQNKDERWENQARRANRSLTQKARGVGSPTCLWWGCARFAVLHW